jgi:TolB-like protein/Flp pilus assembly protein TadD
MSTEIKKEIKLEIGHVLFLDIVGYSKLLINEQRTRREALTQIVRETETFQEADATGTLIKSPTGDGMALVFRGSPEDPVECALQVSRALKSHPELPLRIGVHSGPVSAVVDVNDTTSVAGAGINMAQRVMDCGDAGHILVSKHVAEDLEQYAHWKPYLHELGECEVKHGVRVDLVNLYSDDFGNSRLPKKFEALHRHRARMRLSVAAAGLAILALIIAFFVFAKRSTPSFANISEKSIAVLPFENVSRDPDNAYFAEGIQDEILTRLSKIADLKVISRTSTQHYKSAPENLPEIARQLGVAHILEGSVQKSGDAVRVNVQLIDVARDAHLWAETYDRKLVDIFSVESEVATEIASSLRVALTPQEKARLQAKPTDNVEAYTLYLKARAISDTTSFDVNYTRDSERLYEQAVDLDPGFALAHAGLSIDHSFDYQNFEPTDERKLKAFQAAQEALRLDPALGEGHVALGSYFYRVERNYDQALHEYLLAARALPNDFRLARDLGLMSRRQGRWRDAIAELERAVSLDPRSANVLNVLGAAYADLHDWPAAETTRRRALAVAIATSPEEVEAIKGDLAWLAFSRTGSLAAVQDYVDTAEGDTTVDRFFLGLLERRFDEVERILAETPEREFALPDNSHTPKSLLQGCVALAQGDAVRAKPLFEAALASAETDVRAAPNSARSHAYLGLVYAYLGRKADAIREGRRGVELLPEDKDAWEGPQISRNLSIIYIWVGEYDKALELIKRLLTVPASGVTLLDLRSWWQFDPLRADSRFQTILSSPEPNVIYR